MGLFSFLPLLIIVFAVSLVRSQRNNTDAEQRRREILQEISERSKQSQSQQRPQPQYSQQQRPQTPRATTPVQARPQPAYRPPMEVSRPVAQAVQPRQNTRVYYPEDSTFAVCEEYTNAFQDAYYRAQDRGKDLDPWDLPPERGPWER